MNPRSFFQFNRPPHFFDFLKFIIKKEGQYEIIETHRPVEWYKKIFEDAGLKIIGIFFTPEYELNGYKIENYIYFKLQK